MFVCVCVCKGEWEWERESVMSMYLLVRMPCFLFPLSYFCLDRTASSLFCMVSGRPCLSTVCVCVCLCERECVSVICRFAGRPLSFFSARQKSGKDGQEKCCYLIHWVDINLWLNIILVITRAFVWPMISLKESFFSLTVIFLGKNHWWLPDLMQKQKIQNLWVPL